MRHRVLTLLLAAYLLVWVPAGFATELLAAFPSLDMRGRAAVLELSVHAAVAVLSATAGYMCLVRARAAAPFASAAVVAAAATALQSLWWTVLPRQVAPGQALPLAALSCVLAGFWLLVIAVAVRSQSEGG